MFDIGFWELVLTGIVALLVFGPEKLPGMARTAGYWIGKARRQLNEFRAEFEREVALDEVRRLRREFENSPVKGLAEDIRKVSSFDPVAAIKSPPAADDGKPPA
jgi:sec-independent protein translocase protein TatB